MVEGYATVLYFFIKQLDRLQGCHVNENKYHIKIFSEI